MMTIRRFIPSRFRSSRDSCSLSAALASKPFDRDRYEPTGHPICIGCLAHTGTNHAGLLLPAEVRPWLEPPFLREPRYLKNWVADIGAQSGGQLLGTIETPDLDSNCAGSG